MRQVSCVEHRISDTLHKILIIPAGRIMAPQQAKPIGPARCSLFARNWRGSQFFCEVHSQRAQMLRETIYVEKETPRPSRFIADSSPIGNKTGMREEKGA
jgi:hypothetical protein